MSGLRHIDSRISRDSGGIFPGRSGMPSGRPCNLAGIEVACQTLDRAAFSSRIPSLKSQDHRDPQTIEFPVEHSPGVSGALSSFFRYSASLRRFVRSAFARIPFSYRSGGSGALKKSPALFLPVFSQAPFPEHPPPSLSPSGPFPLLSFASITYQGA